MMGKSDARPPETQTRIDCRGRTARQALNELLPICADALLRGRTPVVIVHHLELLPDSVSRLLKGLDRLAGDLDARILLADGSGLVDAFRAALSGRSHLELLSAS